MEAEVSSCRTSRWKLSLTSKGRVLSKQLKQKVARKKTMTRRPIRGWRKRVGPLVQMGPLGDVLGGGLEALGQDEKGEQKVYRAHSGRPSSPARYCRGI